MSLFPGGNPLDAVLTARQQAIWRVGLRGFIFFLSFASSLSSGELSATEESLLSEKPPMVLPVWQPLGL